MVVVVPACLLGAVAALPFVGALISRDCWCYQRLLTAVEGPDTVQDNTASGLERRRRGWTALILIGGLFVWQYFVFVFIIETDWTAVSARVSLLWYHCVVTLQLVSYVRAVRTVSPAPKTQSSDGPNVCQRCSSLRTKATHHCTACQTCIRGMDHHCVLIHNCVGARNRKFFVLALAYTVLTSGFILARSTARFWRLTSTSVWGLEDCHVCLGYVVAVFVCLGASVLLAVQAFTVAHRIGTLDCLQWAINYPYGRPALARSPAEVMANVQSVFGANPLAWLLPVAPDLPSESDARLSPQRRETEGKQD